VQDPGAVQVAQGAGELDAEVRELGGGQAPAGDEPRQGLARQRLEDDGGPRPARGPRTRGRGAGA
jgi:hypothetical protein